MSVSRKSWDRNAWVLLIIGLRGMSGPSSIKKPSKAIAQYPFGRRGA